MMSTPAYDKFKQLLAELFMFDQADLDFGIYRIMNAKREEITRSAERFLRYQRENAYLLAKGNPQKPARAIPDNVEWNYSGKIHRRD